MPNPTPSTVHARKKEAAANTQRHLPIAEIHNDCVLLKNGGLRAVIRVEAVNFNLKSETEQQGIIAGYGAFVNTITFPLQISIRSSKTNIDEYLDQLRALGEKQENALLKEQTNSYVTFIEHLLDVADIMQKRFYVVVPFDSTATKKTLFSQFMDWLSPDDSKGKASDRKNSFPSKLKALNERAELVLAGLNNIGLHCERLNTRDLLTLYYEVYNPKTSQQQKLPQDLTQLNVEKNTL